MGHVWVKRQGEDLSGGLFGNGEASLLVVEVRIGFLQMNGHRIVQRGGNVLFVEFFPDMIARLEAAHGVDVVDMRAIGADFRRHDDFLGQ